MKTTPHHITALEKGQIFVFGSNLGGKHHGGAARIALENFEAVYGQASGMQGRCYAIPTMDERFLPLELDRIGEFVAEFYAFASEHPELEFLVTAIGTGIAGYSVAQIAPFFSACGDLPNVSLPIGFRGVLQ